MTFKIILWSIAKIILAGIVFAVGTALGGMVAALLQLPAPAPLPGVDMSAVGVYTMLAAPLVALGFVVLARGLGGGFFARSLALAFFAWVAYTVNTQLEASIFTEFGKSIPFALITYAAACLSCGFAVAWLFPAESKTTTRDGFVAFWQRRRGLDWLWRLAFAAVAFMPIYFFFGLLVVPFTGDYYRENLFGLEMPTIDQILPILFVRSLLFLAACLPIIALWQKSDGALFWRMGLALYILVGFVYMLISTWMPLSVRVPHALEILADEFVYAGVLVLLLGKGEIFARKTKPIAPQDARVNRQIR